MITKPVQNDIRQVIVSRYCSNCPLKVLSSEVSSSSSVYSMRSLRSSLATSNLATSSRAVKQASAVTAYTAVPRQTLNLVEAQVGEPSNIFQSLRKYFYASA